jgi:hypothetical protein
MSKKNKSNSIKPIIKPEKSTKPIPWIKLIWGAFIFVALMSTMFGILLPNAWLLIVGIIGSFVGIHYLRKMG